MLSITETRITGYCRKILQAPRTNTIGFVDVGSGGDLKLPWRLLPAELLATADFEPTESHPGSPPLCMSNFSGSSQFFVAHDPRASSIHRADPGFIARFGLQGMQTRETISVACTTLDEHFAGRMGTADALDVNVEGHDFQVLQGAEKFLANGSVKLIKVEFEFVGAFQGQGYFSDIDSFLRARDFRLGGIEIEFIHPVSTLRMHHRGEPVWGKAVYCRTPEFMRSRLRPGPDQDALLAARRETAVAIALYTAAQLPGFALDVIRIAEDSGVISNTEAGEFTAGLQAAFKWARLESGLMKSLDLLRSVTRGLLPWR